jgi:spore germination cell wall hydrolase CwlJ-like protein
MCNAKSNCLEGVTKMKTKKTVLSIIVVLSVLCIFVVLIKSHLTTARSNISISDDTLSTESNVFTEEANNMTTELGVTNEEINPSDTESSVLTKDIKSNVAESDTLSEDNTVVSDAPTDFSVQSFSSDYNATNSTYYETETPAETEKSIVAKKEPELAEAEYCDIGISIAKSYVNIRESASTDAEVLGKLYKNSAARILEKKSDWYYVESGSVTGYVSSEYIKTGLSDDEIIKNYGIRSIIVKVDGLNVRKEPNTESDRETVIYKNEIYPIVASQDEWVKVKIPDENVTGYINSEYTEVIVDFEDAVSKEEELELLKLKEEEQIKKETQIKHQDDVNYSKSDLKLLACLIHAEAGGQSYEGKLAVANIVLNRVKSDEFPDTIKDVIYSPGQFSVATSGSLAKQLDKYDSYSSNSQLLSIKAARDALEGANNVGNRLYFHSYKSALKEGYDEKSNCVKIDDQLYW